MSKARHYYRQPYEDHLDFSRRPALALTVDSMLSSRRGGRPLGQTIFIAAFLIALVYGGYTYFQLKQALDTATNKHMKYQQQQDSLTSQLQGINEMKMMKVVAL